MKEHQGPQLAQSEQLESSGSISMSPPTFSLSASNSGGDPPPTQLKAAAGVVQRQDGDDVNQGGVASDAEALYEAMDGWGTDEAAVFRALEGKSAAHLKAVKSKFAAYGEGSLQSWLESELGGQDYKRAMTAFWPALTVYERLQLQKGFFDDNEEAMIEVIKTASPADIAQASGDGNVRSFIHGELSYADQLKVAKILWPTELYDYTVKFIRNADGILWDDEEEVIMYLLDLSPADRKRMWTENRELFRMFSGYKASDAEVDVSSDFGNVMKVCIGTQAEALEGAMDYATDGWGTEDELVGKVVEETGKAVAAEQALTSELNGEGADALSEEARAEKQAALDQLGGVQENLLSVDDSASELESGSFLDNLHGDVSGAEFEAMTAQMGMDDFDRAKRMILDAVGLWDDEEKIYRAIESIQSQEVRDKLMADEDIKEALTHLNTSEKGVAEAFAANDTYAIAVHKLENTDHWYGRDFGEFFKILLGMTQEDRLKFATEYKADLDHIRIFGSPTQKAALEEIMTTGKLDPATAMEYATVGAGTDDPFVTETLKNMSGEDRLMYRAGYALSKGHVIPTSFMDEDAQATALTKYEEMYAMLAGDLSHDDLQKALDDLVSAPTLPEYTEDGGYELISFILNQRVLDKGATRDGGASDGFIDMFTNTGGTADVAEIAARSQYTHMTADGTIGDDELIEMGRLEKEFGEKHDEYVAAVDTVADVASTIAAIAAAVAVTVATAGTGGAAAAAALASYLGTSSTAVIAGAAAIAGGTAKLVTSEAVGGEHNDVVEEGATDFFVGGVEGAMTVLTAGIAQSLHKSFAGLVGLRSSALASELTVGGLRAAELSLSRVGRQAATGAIRGTIEGILSGAVGELVITAMDEETYRQGVWNTLVSFGEALARGAAMGGVGGAIGGGFMDALSLVVGKARLPQLLSKLEAAGLGPEHFDSLSTHQARMLGEIDVAIREGNTEAAEAAFEKLAREIDPEDAARIRQALFGAGDAADESAEALAASVARVKEVISEALKGDSRLALELSDEEIVALIQKGQQHGHSLEEIADIIVAGSRSSKRSTFDQMIAQLDHLKAVRDRGYPSKFGSAEEFQEFGRDLRQKFNDAGLEGGEVRVFGSSLTKPEPRNIDFALVMSQTEYDDVLKKIYKGKIRYNDKVIDISGRNLQELVDDILANPKSYNGVARNDLLKNFQYGFIAASQGKKAVEKALALKAILASLGEKYPTLNLDDFMLLKAGSHFDRNPYFSF